MIEINALSLILLPLCYDLYDLRLHEAGPLDLGIISLKQFSLRFIRTEQYPLLENLAQLDILVYFFGQRGRTDKSHSLTVRIDPQQCLLHIAQTTAGNDIEMRLEL